MTTNSPIRFLANIGDPQDPLARAGEYGTIVRVQPWCYVVTVEGREYLEFAAECDAVELLEE